MAKDAPGMNNQSLCSMRFGHLHYVLLRGASRDPVISTPVSFSTTRQARLRRLLVSPSKEKHVLILESEEPSIWEINSKDGAIVTNIILRGSRQQAVVGVSSVPVLGYSSFELNRGVGICGITPVGVEASDFRGFAMGAIHPGEILTYPYSGPDSGQAADNTKQRFLQALVQPEIPFKERFFKNFGSKLADSGWRLATSKDLAEWNNYLYQNMQRNGTGAGMLRPDKDWSVVLAANGPVSTYLEVPSEYQPRLIYLGRRSQIKGNLQGATLLNIETASCLHSPVANPCAIGHASDNWITKEVKDRIEKLYGWRLP